MATSFTRRAELPLGLDFGLARGLDDLARSHMPSGLAWVNWSAANAVGSVGGALDEVVAFVLRYGPVPHLSMNVSPSGQEAHGKLSVTSIKAELHSLASNSAATSYSHGTFEATSRDLDVLEQILAELALLASEAAGEQATFPVGLGTRTFRNDPPSLPLALEEAAGAWLAVVDLIPLGHDDRRTADAVGHLVGELAKNAEPDRQLVRASLGWMKKRLDLFSDEFAKAAGTASGKVVPVAASLVLTDRFVHLTGLVDKILAAVR